MMHPKHFIKMVTKQPLSKSDIKAWLQTVKNHAPSGTVLSTSEVALIYQETISKIRSYIVPLSRNLTVSEAERIINNLSIDADYDIEIDTNNSLDNDEVKTVAAEMRISDDDYKTLCFDLAKQRHADWLSERLDAGWRYGIEFDALKKTHPLLKPWEQLPDRYKTADMTWPQTLVKFLADRGHCIVDQKDLDMFTK